MDLGLIPEIEQPLPQTMVFCLFSPRGIDTCSKCTQVPILNIGCPLNVGGFWLLLKNGRPGPTRRVAPLPSPPRFQEPPGLCCVSAPGPWAVTLRPSHYVFSTRMIPLPSGQFLESLFLPKKPWRFANAERRGCWSVNLRSFSPVTVVAAALGLPLSVLGLR